GEYEQLRDEIYLPTRAPDYGPAEIGPAGAVIVGARGFLVAYNLFLQSDDVAVARRIARAIRQSNGGLSGVKAMGLLVNGRAQVSMNLVDFRQTPLHVVVDTVSRLAQAEGVSVAHAELIGLLPQEVVFQAAAQALKLPELTARAVVESALQLALDAQDRAVAQTIEDTGA
ncbi:MAG: glutamate formiminotransferase, partial [Caldilineaceae bacterium]|nr:glutamate formiminotransferase [Caldilineaceae bacterium]